MAVEAIYIGRLNATSSFQRLLVHYWKTGTVLVIVFFLATSILQTPALDDTSTGLLQADLEESMTQVSDDKAWLYVSDGREFMNRGLIYIVSKPTSRHLIYVDMSPPSMNFILGLPNTVYDEGRRLTSEEDTMVEYFKTIRTPTGFCRKLVRIGGDMYCIRNTTMVKMDGHKFVCLDPEFQIGGSLTKTTDCLALSFGIETEYSFDLGIRNANCELHMFDILDYKPQFVQKDNFTHFHKFGLGVNREEVQIKAINTTVSLHEFYNILNQLGLENRLINVLKVDIEAAEWDIFENLFLRSNLDNVGQIAIELHAFEPYTGKFIPYSKFRKYLKILDTFEERGFRRISYWDTITPKTRIKDRNGRLWERAGELLLVNSNWYNNEFRMDMKKIGYNFINI